MKTIVPKNVLPLVFCACGKPKLQGFPFCGICFLSLPKDLRHELRRQPGFGFESAYFNSHKFLRMEVWGK